MRTTIDLPDALYRELKARAALEGRSVKDLMHSLLRRALSAPAVAATPPARGQPPSVSAGGPLPLATPSNASLFGLLDAPPCRPRQGRPPKTCGRERLAGAERARACASPSRACLVALGCRRAMPLQPHHDARSDQAADAAAGDGLGRAGRGGGTGRLAALDRTARGGAAPRAGRVGLGIRIVGGGALATAPAHRCVPGSLRDAWRTAAGELRRRFCALPGPGLAAPAGRSHGTVTERSGRSLVVAGLDQRSGRTAFARGCLRATVVYALPQPNSATAVRSRWRTSDSAAAPQAAAQSSSSRTLPVGDVSFAIRSRGTEVGRVSSASASSSS